MWELKVWTRNKKHNFVIKTETLEEMTEMRNASIRMGYLPNKKCWWVKQAKYNWNKHTKEGAFKYV
jgi:hypothetical protein